MKKRSLLIPRHDEANATTSNISKANMESAELIANDEEHAIGFPRVLDLGQKLGVEAEG